MVVEIFNGIYLYDVDIDLNGTMEALEDIAGMEDSQFAWKRMHPLSLKHTNFGFENLEDDTKVDLSFGSHLFLHELSLIASEVFTKSAIDYCKKKDMPNPLFPNFIFTKFANGSKQLHMKDNHNNETNKIVSFKYFINDNFDGGEIEFVDLGIKIKPKFGQLLIHPAEHHYLEHEVKNGNKYQLICWL